MMPAQFGGAADLGGVVRGHGQRRLFARHGEVRFLHLDADGLRAQIALLEACGEFVALLADQREDARLVANVVLERLLARDRLALARRIDIAVIDPVRETR